MTKAPELYEINMDSSNLNPILEQLEGNEINSNTRSKTYTTIINSFHIIENLEYPIAERLLAICVKDVTRDLQYFSSVITVISFIIKKIKEGKCEYLPANLVPSALTIVNITKKLLQKPLFRKVSIDSLISYPDETLIALVLSHSEDIIDLIDYYPKLDYQSEITELMTSFIARLLQILPKAKKMSFVQKGLNAWFNTIIPGILAAGTGDTTSKSDILALELLTECLIEIDYANNPKWHNILADICDQKKYPFQLKSALERGSDSWHTLWKIFITLLKDQITKINKSGVSPINALLPVVELAFKMDAHTRCRAFECWNVLIDNFSKELNETLVNKRLKLLMIPLKLNNAKVEETVLAKLNTWWHLIGRFHGKMDKLTDTVLIPFIHFCFGKPTDKSQAGKIVAKPGQMTNILSLKCIEVLVEIFGHVESNCDCCTLPSVGGRLITTKLLAEHWTLWVLALETALKTAANNYYSPIVRKITCLWKGYVTIIAELPENQIRADLFIELLKCVESVLMICKSQTNAASLIYDILISPLDGNPTIRPLLKSKNETGPLYVILRIIQNSAMILHLSRYKDPEEKISKMKPVASVLMDPSLTDPDEFLKHWATKEAAIYQNRLWLWAAIVDAILESKCELKSLDQSIINVCVVLLPLKMANNDDQINSEAIWYRWYKLFSYVQTAHVTYPIIVKEIEDILTAKSGVETANFLMLYTSLALLKLKLLNDKNTSLENEAKILLNALTASQDIFDSHCMDKYFSLLSDTLFLFLKRVSRFSTIDLAKLAVSLVQITFKCLIVELKKNCDEQKRIYIDNLQDYSRKFLEKLMKNVAFVSLKPEIANAYKIKAEVDHIVTSKSNITKPINNSDSNASETKPTEQKDVDKSNFTTPQPKSAKKTKANKKELNIVNTVVENGEEFVVVQSHWKFNPKKLTENQKDKFKRKREDIPALYQDLSQSQDEFKLRTWKTDSQDATTSKSESNSKSKDDAAVSLHEMPSAEVVPKILENIFPTATNNNEKTAEDNDNNNKLQKTPTVKGPKTPRLALKDRVFRNVRNLIEKSGLQSEGKVNDQVVEDTNQTVAAVNENDLKTPVSKSKTVLNVANSAPPKLLTERPSRSIKKPKKFEDTEVFALKKKRRSQDSGQSNSQPDNAASDKKAETLKEHDTITNKVDINRKKDDGEASKIITDPQKEPQMEENPRVPKLSDKDIMDNQITPSSVENSKTPEITEPDSIKSDHAETVNDKIEIEECKTPEQSINTNNDIGSQIIEEISTPIPEKTKKKDDVPSTIKKKRSRIEKQLLIDMVEGHPVLQQTQSEKRLTRKNLTNEIKDTVSKRRQSLIEKSNKIKAELVSAGIVDVQSKEKTKPGSKSSSPKSGQQKVVTVPEPEAEQQSQTITIMDSQEPSSESQEDTAMSEDIIESSQDSTLTTISVKSSASKKKVPIVCLDKENQLCKSSVSETQNLIDDFNNEVIPLSDTLNETCNQESREDIELPKNKTMPEENAEVDLTENMDTEPMDSSGEVIIINDEVATPIVINTEDTTVVGKETQEMAEADTLPMDVESQSITSDEVANVNENKVTLEAIPTTSENDVTNVSSQEDITPTLSGPAEVVTDIIVESSNTGSPLKDEIQRKKDFLNDTIEISPIKTLSPVREKKSPSPETSSDYVVIKLTSPVQSNGEPFIEKCDSPEVFTEEKISPDKRDQSPPRKEITTSNSSPSSSLSLKKNRPQMRFNGRAAQMLGLCVPEKLQIINTERSENDEGRKSSAGSTPARKNLKRFYTGENENQANENESEENENFLKFTRPIPTAESSPSNPILKRKLIDITDECTISPASKRKRVSFHDPPVSTTVAVQKYIEPCGVRSPSNSAIKRQERQLRALTGAKSPKRLENVFRLETVLTKAIESFDENAVNSNDTEMSLDETPAAEVVKTSELNDTDPICPELLDCKDPIENIAAELSSPSTKALLIKELEGKVETVADLAKMTELEVNRLCIKAPKVKIAKKVLCKYASEKVRSQEILLTPTTPVEEEPVVEVERVDNESQTNEVSTNSTGVQTTDVAKVLVFTQTEPVPTKHYAAQTDESGSKSTKDVISTCLNERPDFVDQLTQQLQLSSVQQISNKLPFDSCLSLLLNKMTASNSTEALNKVITQTSKYTMKESKGMDLNALQEHLCKRFDSKDLILFCSQLLQRIHDKPS